MNLNIIKRTTPYSLYGREEPPRGASNFELAMITLSVVAVIGLSGLLV